MRRQVRVGGAVKAQQQLLMSATYLPALAVMPQALELSRTTDELRLPCTCTGTRAAGGQG